MLYAQVAANAQPKLGMLLGRTRAANIRGTDERPLRLSFVDWTCCEDRGFSCNDLLHFCPCELGIGTAAPVFVRLRSQRLAPSRSSMSLCKLASEMRTGFRPSQCRASLLDPPVHRGAALQKLRSNLLAQRENSRPSASPSVSLSAGPSVGESVSQSAG